MVLRPTTRGATAARRRGWGRRIGRWGGGEGERGKDEGVREKGVRERE